MNTTYRFCLVSICFLILSFSAIAQQFEPENPDKFRMGLTVGITGAYNTRVVKQEKRSNFVFTDTLVGLEISTIVDIPRIPLLYARLAALYPITYTFNNVPQAYKNILRYSVDFSAGAVIPIPFFFRTKINLLPVIHLNFLHEDRFDFLTAGIGAGAQLSVPIIKRQAIAIQYAFTYDFLDFGTNATIEPLAHRYMHNVSVSYTIF